MSTDDSITDAEIAKEKRKMIEEYINDMTENEQHQINICKNLISEILSNFGAYAYTALNWVLLEIESYDENESDDDEEDETDDKTI